MPEIPNIVGHLLGPLLWLGFAAVVAWYAVRGAMLERREAPAYRRRLQQRVRAAALGRPRFAVARRSRADRPSTPGDTHA